METPENVQFIRRCLFPCVHFWGTVRKSNVSIFVDTVSSVNGSENGSKMGQQK